jgi:RNA polymerase sigma factor (sigma-70 family)
MILDGELLRRYSESHSEEAFATLVHRHLDLVYSAALRQLNGDAHLAQDVAQIVFTDLARKAAVLSQRPVLTGWLYTCAHFAAAKAVRTEHRRQAREQEAHAMNELLQASTPDFDWENLGPVLDKLMHELKESDREVILMRYFENRPLAAIGEALGVSEDTARKRVERALEKLRSIVSKQAIGAAVPLGVMLSTHAVQMAPAGLAATLTGASLAGAAVGTGTTLVSFSAMAITKFQTGITGAVVLAGILTPLIFQQRALADLRQQNFLLGRQADQLAQRSKGEQNLTTSVSSSPSLPADQFSELLRLRGEAGLQRDELKKMRAKLAARRNSAAARASAIANYFPKASWAAAGCATPEAALQSLIWAQGQAFENHDTNSLSTLLGTNGQAAMKKEFAGKDDKEIAATLDGAAKEYGTLDGMRIVNKQTISDDEVMMTYMVFLNNGTNDGWGRASVKRVGNNWMPTQIP